MSKKRCFVTLDSDTTSTLTESEQYVYHTLPSEHVRLMELYSDAVDAPLQCRIFESPLHQAPPYEALSYVWGPQEPPQDLKCHSSCSDVFPSVLHIGPNLHSALVHLRFHPSVSAKPRLLWVDRICINQNDPKERAAQVLLMRYIYRECWQGLVWLGEGNQEIKDAFLCARYIHENDLGHMGIPWTTLAQFKSPPVDHKSLKKCFKALARLTYRPWFERSWTFQEAILPPAITLVCGDDSMPLGCLEACRRPVVHQIGSFASENADLVFVTRNMAIDNAPKVRLPSRDLERLLTARRQNKASDPHDIIYSLMGLFSTVFSRSLSPDYSISIKRLFTAVAIHILRKSSELRLLCSVESPKHIDGDVLPSWVPDWRAPPESYRDILYDRDPKSGYRATRGSAFTYESPRHKNELHVYGILIGRVNKVGAFKHSHTINDFKLPDRYSQTSQPMTTALRQVQTLNFNHGILLDQVISNSHPQRKSFAAFYDLPTGSHSNRRKCNECSLAHAMPLISMGTAEKNPNLTRIVQSCRKMVRTRTFFTTDSGHIGFGPKCTTPGDQVYILIGSDMPFLLRPAGKKFELVGACYVHGIMYGEGLHPDFGFDSRFYPGSTPGDEWDFSAGKVRPATWRTIGANGECLHSHGSVRHGPTATGWSDTTQEPNRKGFPRFSMCEDERDPVLIQTERIIIK